MTTQSQLIWEWFQAHPGKTAQACSKSTGILTSSVTSQISSMRNRGMVRRTKAMHFNDQARKVIAYTYTVVGHMYKLQPLPTGWVPRSKPKKSVRPLEAPEAAQASSLANASPDLQDPATALPPPSAPHSQPTNPPYVCAVDRQQTTAQSIVDSLPVKTAKEVYTLLREIFNA